MLVEVLAEVSAIQKAWVIVCRVMGVLGGDSSTFRETLEMLKLLACYCNILVKK